MKKNIIGIFAVVIALAASAFTVPSKAVNHNHKKDNLMWFSISGNVLPSSQTPSANATYLSGDDGPEAPDNDCSGTAHQCISGFESTQVNLTTNKLIGSQTPQDQVDRDN